MPTPSRGLILFQDLSGTKEDADATAFAKGFVNGECDVPRDSSFLLQLSKCWFASVNLYEYLKFYGKTILWFSP